MGGEPLSENWNTLLGNAFRLCVNYGHSIVKRSQTGQSVLIFADLYL